MILQKWPGWTKKMDGFPTAGDFSEFCIRETLRHFQVPNSSQFCRKLAISTPPRQVCRFWPRIKAKAWKPISRFIGTICGSVSKCVKSATSLESSSTPWNAIVISRDCLDAGKIVTTRMGNEKLFRRQKKGGSQPTNESSFATSEPAFLEGQT